MSKLGARSLLEALGLLGRIVSAGRHGPLLYLIFLASFGLSDLLVRYFFQLTIGPGYALFGIAYLGGFVVSMVRLQHFVVYGTTYAPNGFLGLWSIRETRFFGYLLVMFFGAITTVLIFRPLATEILNIAALVLPDVSSITKSGLIWLPALILVLPVAYAIARLSFVFPAAAINLPCGLLDSWRLAKANSLRLTLVMGVLILADFGVEHATAELVEPAKLVLRWVNNFLSLIIWSLFVALAYKKTIGREAPG